MFGRKTLEFMLICIGDEMRDSLRESTAPCLQGVSTEFVLIETHREGDVPHVASNVRYIAFSMRTNTLLTPSKVRAFTSHEFLTLNYIGVRSQLENQRKCNVRYIAFPKCIRKIRIIRVQNIRHLRAGCSSAPRLLPPL